MKAYTDYPFTSLGDTEGMEAPIREIDVISYDGDKYCTVRVEGFLELVKSGYIYQTPGRKGQVPPLTRRQLIMLKKDIKL